MKTAVTKENQEGKYEFFHVSKTYAKSNVPLKCRRSGKTKTWITRPEAFQISVSIGLYYHFYINERNAKDWEVEI